MEPATDPITTGLEGFEKLRADITHDPLEAAAKPLQKLSRGAAPGSNSGSYVNEGGLIFPIVFCGGVRRGSYWSTAIGVQTG